MKTGGAAVHSVAFSPDGKLLAAANGGRTVSLWEIAGRMPLAPLSLERAAVWSVAFSPVSGLLALGSAQIVSVVDNKVILVDVGNRKPLGDLNQIWPVFGVAFSPDGSLLASVGGYSVTLWSADAQSWRRLACSVVNRNLSRSEWREVTGASVSFRLVCPDLPEFVE
jgi:WD40 repeat protein